jgi:hypothetical protein
LDPPPLQFALRSAPPANSLDSFVTRTTKRIIPNFSFASWAAVLLRPLLAASASFLHVRANARMSFGAG